MANIIKITASDGTTYDIKDAGAARSGHTHTTSIAASTGTNQLTLSANTKYAITAGGTSYVFTTPTDTNTWRPQTDWNAASTANNAILNKPSSLPASDVYAWAKASTKPSYTASEVGAVPTTRKVNGKALSADISLTAADVGAVTTDTKNTVGNNKARPTTFYLVGVSSRDTTYAESSTFDGRASISGGTLYIEDLNVDGGGYFDGSVELTGNLTVGGSITSGGTAVVLTNDSRMTNARPASDVYAWAKASTKPSYTYSEVGAAAASHTHNYAGSSSAGGKANSAVVADYAGYISSPDTRNANPLPKELSPMLRADFKSNSAIGLSGHSSYSGVITFRSYGSTTDFSGGPAYRIAMAQDGVILYQTGDGSGWGSWSKLNAGYADTAGSANAVAWGNVTGKPSFATVATSGSYNDLSNKPTIPAAQVQTDWNATSGMGVLLNKPSSLPASDVYAWAKASTKPSYTYSEVGAAASNHTHSSVNDAGNSTATTFAYSKAGLSTTSWFAAWNSYELRAISPANVLSTIGAVPTSRTVNGKALSSNISLTAADVGAATTDTKNTVGNESTRTGTFYLVGVGSQDSSGGYGTSRTWDGRAFISGGTLYIEDLNVDGSGYFDGSLECTGNLDVGGTIKQNGTAVSLAGHTHNYAGSSSAGGAATSANKLNTNAGSATNPVYFSGGVPVACTYSLNKTVPSDAKFTDTVTTATTTGSGNAVTAISASNGALTVTKGSTFSTSGHTHATSIATTSDGNQITLAASTKYKLTAGGTSYVFTTPPSGGGGGSLNLQLVASYTGHSSSNTSSTITFNTTVSPSYLYLIVPMLHLYSDASYDVDYYKVNAAIMLEPSGYQTWNTIIGPRSKVLEVDYEDHQTHPLASYTDSWLYMSDPFQDDNTGDTQLKGRVQITRNSYSSNLELSRLWWTLNIYRICTFDAASFPMD